MILVAVVMGKMHAGGKKNLVMEYYRHIDRNRIQFDFYCDADSNSIPFEEIESLGGRVYLIPPYQHIIANMRAMKKLFKVNQYPILHSYNSTMSLFSMLVGKRAGIPVRINESISMGHKRDKKNTLKKLLKPFSTCFATNYMSNGEICGKWQFGDKLFDEGKVAVFKTIIDTEKHRFEIGLREECRKKLGLEDNIVVGHIGRFTIQKNTLFIIDVFNEIARQEPKAKLLIIGHGELDNQMTKKICEYGLESRVLNLGKREDIHQFYNAMDCFLLPSLYEGLPVVGIEAECSGLPVFFSTEVPRESSPCDDLGFFIKLDDGAKKWAERVLLETKKSIGNRRDHSEELRRMGFDSNIEGQKLGDYYEELIARTKDKAVRLNGTI